MTDLTKIQQAVLDFVRSFIADNGYSPTLWEIATNFGWASPSSSLVHLNALVRKGRVRRTSSKYRGLAIVETPDEQAKRIIAQVERLPDETQRRIAWTLNQRIGN